ncbi:hypothetical protein V8E36_007520, partial [Tilletia maclaganii]
CGAVTRVPAQDNKKLRGDWITKGCGVCAKAGRGTVELEYRVCTARLILTTYTEAGIGIFEHFGTHDHGKPDVRKLRPTGVAQLRKVVLAHPHTKAVGLSTGKVKTGSGAVVDVQPARTIDPALINQDRLAAKRLELLREAGILPTGSRDGPVLDLLDIQGDGTSGE